MTMNEDMASESKFVIQRKVGKDIASAYFDSWLNVIPKFLFPQFDSFFYVSYATMQFLKTFTAKKMNR